MFQLFLKKSVLTDTYVSLSNICTNFACVEALKKWYHIVYNLKGIVFQIQFGAGKMATLHFIAKIFMQLWFMRVQGEPVN